FWGGVAGFAVGTAITLADDNHSAEPMRWGTVIGTFAGLGAGIYFVATRPIPEAMLEIRDGRLAPNPAALAAVEPAPGAAPGGARGRGLGGGFGSARGPGGGRRPRFPFRGAPFLNEPLGGPAAEPTSVAGPCRPKLRAPDREVDLRQVAGGPHTRPRSEGGRS